jgi:hypothetical protein
MDPYQTLAKLKTTTELPIGGFLLKRGRTCIGLALWEYPRTGDIVPGLAALPSSYEKGLSEYIYYSIAKWLLREGYDRMCIGGSETAGLDHFKQKLDPIATRRLRTLRLSPQEQGGTATEYVNQQIVQKTNPKVPSR